MKIQCTRKYLLTGTPIQNTIQVCTTSNIVILLGTICSAGVLVSGEGQRAIYYCKRIAKEIESIESREDYFHNSKRIVYLLVG